MNTSIHAEKTINPARSIFIAFCAAFIIGDVIGCLWDIWSLIFMVMIISGIYSFHIRSGSRFIALLGILGMSVGYLVGLHWVRQYTEWYERIRTVTHDFTRKWTLRGDVESLLYAKERSKVYQVSIDTFDTIDTPNGDKDIHHSQTLWGDARFSLFIEIPSNLTLEVWDRIRFSGLIKKNITFPLLGYDRYAYFHGWFGYIFLTTFFREPWGDTGIIHHVKDFWIVAFERYFPRDVTGTLLGMTIGSIELLTQEVRAAFLASGTSHILVVSGSNIAFLIIILTFFLKYIPLHRGIRSLVIVGCILFYGTLVWWDVSVVRAAIMGIISYVIVEYDGRGASRSILAFTGVILILWSPLAPLYDAGFGLSFAATFGILIFHPMIEKWCKKYNIPHTLTSLISVSIWAMLGSLPLVIYHFERIPLSSLMANILIWPLLGWILFSCIFFVGIQSISHILAIWVGFFVYIPTKAILLITSFFANGWVLSIPHIIAPYISLFMLGVFLFIFIENDIISKKRALFHSK